MRYAILLGCLMFVSVVSAETLVYFGTYTRDGGSEGIYVSRLNSETGELSTPVLAAKAVSPSFVAISPNGECLYAASEIGESGPAAASVLAYRINDDGRLSLLNTRSSGGGGACHVSVDPTGTCLAVANYGGGSCASFPILSSGALGERASFHQHRGTSVNPKRQSAPHGHSINFNGDGSQAFVADLGMDQILMYDVDAKSGTMTPSAEPFMKTPSGGGPRHFCFLPDYSGALSNLELTSEVMLLGYDSQKKDLQLRQVESSLPGGKAVKGNSTAECLVHPNGRFAYVSNRGHNSVAIFELGKGSNALRAIGHHRSGGEVPRGFGIDPGGRFLVVANQKSGEIVSLKIDPETGGLSPSGSEVKLDSPVNVRFVAR